MSLVDELKFNIKECSKIFKKINFIKKLIVKKKTNDISEEEMEYNDSLYTELDICNDHKNILINKIKKNIERIYYTYPKTILHDKLLSITQWIDSRKILNFARYYLNFELKKI